MNKKKFYINLYVLIPVIYSGITIIGIILTYQLLNQYENNNQISSLGFVYLITAIGFLTYLISSLIVRILLRPVMQFINKAQIIPILKNSTLEKQESITDDLDKITMVFDDVANILSHLEAKELFPDVIASSPSMRNIFTQIMKVAPTDSTVPITGESGTGKELIAASIYEHSARKGKPFIKINCVAIPEGLLESELFGYEKGAFTGANTTKLGLFEVANNGTVFLDEVSELSLPAQVKLLRVLQEGEIEKIGRTGSISVNVRIISATNKNLAAAVKDGRLREDLFYRLNVIPIDVVPLRQRGNDIIVLFKHFLEYFSDDMGIVPPGIDPKAQEILMNYKWPGNVRELRNVAQRLVLNCTDHISVKDVSDPMILKSSGISKDAAFEEIYAGHALTLHEVERAFRLKYFKYIRNISSSDANAAEKLGIAPSNFYRMCKELGLK